MSWGRDPFAPPITGSEAPCRSACPVGTDAAAYVALVEEEAWAAGYDVARAPNPFPSICGRVCAAPCERGCRRRILDEAVSIRALKRVLCDRHGAEQGVRSRWHRPLGTLPPISGPSVGIVGGGPAGLAAAHDLRRSGIPVRIYEATDRVGGMMRWGIPPFRLPREVLDAECDAVLGMGMEVETNTRVGMEIEVRTLLARHGALLITVGCQRGRSLEVPGAREPGVIRAIDFLRGGESLDAGPVVVIGGGSVAFDAARSAWRAMTAYDGQTALDAARSARRAGAGTVMLVAPEAAMDLPVSTEELNEARTEGVVVRGGEGIVRILAGERVTGVEVAPVLSLRHPDGRFGPVLDPDGTHTLPAATVVLAIGQEADTDFLEPLRDLERTPWGGIVADEEQRSSHPRIWAAGDVATGPKDLIDAIAAGRRAASSIARHLETSTSPDRIHLTPKAPPLQNRTRFWSGYQARERTALPVLAPADRRLLDEVEQGFPAAQGRREAARCLRCDEQLQFVTERCIACGLCVDVCPQGSLALLPAGGSRLSLTFEDETCIRCQLCVHRCPTAALAFRVAPVFGPPAACR